MTHLLYMVADGLGSGFANQDRSRFIRFFERREMHILFDMVYVVNAVIMYATINF
jgi:hypothetical protein